MSDVPGASSTVAVGGIEITSNTGTAESMVESLKSDKPETGEPRVLVDEGKAVEADPEKERVSKAASELGKKGGEAAAKAKAAAAKGNGKEPAAEAKPEAPAAPEKGDEAPAPAQADKRKGDPRFDLQARVREQSEQLRAERAARERLAAEVEQLRRGTAPAAQNGAERPAAPAADAKPKEDDFETHEEYLDARDQWNRRQWAREDEVRQRAKAETDSIGVEVNAFMERMTNHPDAEHIDPNLLRVLPSFAVEPAQRTKSTDMAQELLRSSYSPQLYRHFTEHPEDMRRIVNLSTRDMQRAIARLEARFEDSGEAPTAAPAKTPPAAPPPSRPPFRPVTPSPHVGEPDIYGEIDFDTFAKRRKAK